MGKLNSSRGFMVCPATCGNRTAIGLFIGFGAAFLIAPRRVRRPQAAAGRPFGPQAVERGGLLHGRDPQRRARRQPDAAGLPHLRGQAAGLDPREQADHPATRGGGDSLHAAADRHERQRGRLGRHAGADPGGVDVRGPGRALPEGRGLHLRRQPAPDPDRRLRRQRARRRRRRWRAAGRAIRRPTSTARSSRASGC